MVFFGIFLLIAGLGLQFYVGRKKFYRRNVAGVEEFSGYGKALATGAIEKIMQIVGGLLIILGVLVLISSLVS